MFNKIIIPIFLVFLFIIKDIGLNLLEILFSNRTSKGMSNLNEQNKQAWKYLIHR